MIKKRGQEAKRQALYRISGVDITQIDAIGVETVEVVLSEYGSNLSRFPTEKQFVSHVTLAPHVPKSGGKAVKKRKRNGASTRVRDRQEVGHANLPAVTMGPTLPRRRCSCLRKSLPPAAHQELKRQG
jgi:transposase